MKAVILLIQTPITVNYSTFKASFRLPINSTQYNRGPCHFPTNRQQDSTMTKPNRKIICFSLALIHNIFYTSKSTTFLWMKKHSSVTIHFSARSLYLGCYDLSLHILLRAINQKNEINEIKAIRRCCGTTPNVKHCVGAHTVQYFFNKCLSLISLA